MIPPALRMAQQMLDEGKLEQAEAAARRALAASPRDPNVLSLLGTITFARVNYAQSEYFTRQLLAVRPGARVQANLGATLVAQGKHEEAAGHLRMALEGAPEDDAARISLVGALMGMNRPMEARGVAAEGLTLLPGHPGLTDALANAMHACGRVDEAIPLVGGVLGSGRGTLALLHRWAIMHAYASTTTQELVARAHRQYGLAVEQARAARPARRALEGRPLRVGLLSQDFRTHSVAHVIEPFVEHADRSRVTVVCYSTSALQDAVTARFKAKADLWRAVATLSHRELAGQIAKDQIDVLVDLAGHTEGRRLETLALRPAPVQVTYAGYPCTTGLASVDYRVVDALTNPEGSPDFGTEKLLRVEGCSTVYRPPEGVPEVSALPALARGSVTFGAFGSVLKYNDRVLGAWARVLQAVPGSRLVLKHFSLGDAALRAEVVQRMERLGARAGSVVAMPPVKDAAGHLGAYSEVDISLDTFPYNGTVTILESLLMGVPVVSFTGEGTAGRMGLSLLTAAGLAELCAKDEEGFVEVAGGLARNVERLAELRRGLRGRLLGSPLCDGAGFAARMVNVLHQAWGEPAG